MAEHNRVMRLDRNDALQVAADIINGSRANTYGDAGQSMERIAALWSAYMGIEIKPRDAAAMLSLLKISRIRSGSKPDNWVDLIGYAAIGAEIEGGDWKDEG